MGCKVDLSHLNQPSVCSMVTFHTSKCVLSVRTDCCCTQLALGPCTFLVDGLKILNFVPCTFCQFHKRYSGFNLNVFQLAYLTFDFLIARISPVGLEFVLQCCLVNFDGCIFHNDCLAVEINCGTSPDFVFVI